MMDSIVQVCHILTDFLYIERGVEDISDYS